MPAKKPKSQKRVTVGTRLLPAAVTILNRWKRKDQKLSTYLAEQLEQLAAGNFLTRTAAIEQVRAAARLKVQAYREGGNELMAAAAAATGDEIAATLEER